MSPAARALVTRVLPMVPGLGVVAWGSWCGWGGSKDDTWISFRYAKNLWDGLGPTFNPGEPPVEGYTNFLWTLALVPIVGTGGDPLVGAAILGALLTAGSVVAVVAGVRALGGSPVHAALGGLICAAWPDLLLWSVRGLEQGMMGFFVATGLLVALAAHDRSSAPLAAFAGLLLAAACLTRPEGHALVGVVGLAFAGARWWAGTAAFGAAAGGVLAPYTLWRYATFGSLVPNTYLVKGGGGFSRWELGVAFVGNMLADEQTWLVLLLAAAALLWAPRQRRVPVAVGLTIVAVFLVYMVKVGTDEFPRYRLFLPAWPVVATLAAYGASRFPLAGAWRWLPVVPLAIWVAIGIRSASTMLPAGGGGIDEVRFGYADLGKYLTRHSRPGEVVAIQDVGAPAFHAPDLVFLDTIGLVDRNITALYQKYGYQPFARLSWRADPELRKKLDAFNEEARAYLEDRDPDWVAYAATMDTETSKGVTAAFRKARDLNPVDRWLGGRSYYFGWANERSFRDRYTYVRTWRRTATFWITLWRRNDHAALPPPEVVLDRAPESLAGGGVELAGGHRVLGGKVSPRARHRDEVWVDVYVALAGPEEPNTLAEMEIWHLDEEGRRTKVAWVDVHVPGDWMWPAERWQPGQILRDRVQIQLHRRVEPGRYGVTWRLEHRPTGRVVARTDAGPDGRVDVGAFTVRERTWWELAFIRPTRPADQRAPPIP